MLQILNILFLVFVSLCFSVIFYYSFIEPKWRRSPKFQSAAYSLRKIKLLKIILKGCGFSEKSA
ncbi:hypothetical protein CUU66_01300 [Peribacillus deserti]|uniref:Uncharacterized protein n=1 Tax=Peribacillus deserti TaxID=673318 RepID=A0A2N5MBS7_9BACI|nr:hypothetical protein CUU66_01300 [Peribacillus deserti]